MGNTSHTISSNVFTGAQNTDIDPRLVKNTDFIDALNIRNGYGVDVGAVTNIKGNVNVLNNAIPSIGVNKCVGSYEDRDNNSIIYFIWNNLGDHSIFRFTAPSIITLIAQGGILEFDQDRPIHSIKLLDSRFLCWADARKDGMALTGNEVRCLDIIKAQITDKVLTYDVHVPLTDQISEHVLSVGTTLNLVQSDATGVVITTNTLTLTTNASKELILNDLATQINAIGGFNVVNLKGKKLIINRTAAEIRLSFTFAGGQPQNWAIAVPVNHYSHPLRKQHIQLIKEPPRYPPTAAFISENYLGENHLYRTTPQYMVRYIYDGNQKSRWGHLSIIPNTLTASGEPSDVLNKILLSFYDTRLNLAEWLCCIRKIEIGVKYSNSGVYHLIRTLDVSEIGTATPTVVFNVASKKGNYVVIEDTNSIEIIGSDENIVNSESQVIGNFDFIPFKTETIELVSDETGNTRLVLAGNESDQDNVSVLNVTFSQTDKTIYPRNPTNDNRPFTAYKRGGIYRVGITYMDDANRQGAIQEVGQFEVDRVELKANYSLPIVSMAISHLPPTWATKYSISVTRNLKHADYMQALGLIYFGKINDTGDFTPLAQGDSQYTFISIPNYNKYEKVETIFDDIAASQNAVKFVARKDRVRLIAKEPTPADEDSIVTFGQVHDLEVVGYAFINAGVGTPNSNYYIIAEKINPLYVITTDQLTIVEVYTPNEITTEAYYETGQVFDIIGGYHAGDTTQTAVSPATVVLSGGDTKWRKYKYSINSGATIQINSAIVEDMGYTPYEDGWTRNEGRLNVTNPTAKRRYIQSDIRISQLFIPQSGINGVSSFRGTDYIRIEIPFGAVRKLIKLHDTLLAICEFKTQPIYVSKARLLALDGNSQVGRTDKILNIAQETVHDYGTMNPESVSYFDGRIYAYDIHNGIVWRFAADGQTDISAEGKLNYFNAVSQARRLYSEADNRVISNVDTQYKTIYFTFYSRVGSGISSFTEAYEDSSISKGWKGRMSFTPEMYGRVGQFFASFIGGEMWLHNSIVVAACNFYGVQYTSYIEFIHNSEPSSIKTPYKIIEQATDIWAVDRAQTYTNLSYPQGQLSKIPSTRFNVYEGKIEGEFLRNQIDPAQEFAVIVNQQDREAAALLRGELLKYDAMKIRLLKRNPQTIGTIIKVDISFTKSENTM